MNLFISGRCWIQGRCKIIPNKNEVAVSNRENSIVAYMVEVDTPIGFFDLSVKGLSWIYSIIPVSFFKYATINYVFKKNYSVVFPGL